MAPVCLALFAALTLFSPVAAQVITIDRNGNATTSTDKFEGYVDRRFRQVEPTHVELPATGIDSRTRLQLIRVLEAEQGFAMRPIPRGHRGLTLEANGKLNPAGERYLSMVTAEGICAKPGARVVITDVKVEHSRIVLQLNGGPDFKHRFLRHIQIGAGPMMNPVIQESSDQTPQGARITLTFHGAVPAITGKQVEALLEPLISFNVKTPVEAFTDTLPPMLKSAILSHRVLVGMSTDMVLFAKGRPQQKYREVDGQMPVEIWIYGKPPQEVDFVRINGNRVIGVEIGKVGQPLQVFNTDVVEGMMRSDGTPLISGAARGTRTVQMGDVQRNPDTQAPAPPPTLRNPGEALPAQDSRADRVGVMRPVQFPKQKPDDDSVNASTGAPAATPPAAPTAPVPQPSPTPQPQ
ncbi:MAG TPA: hypothetical protein VMV57_00195 [Terracidiphilus sp.]|nr:hypothetical protein [Terracidiphilus sp.]